MKYAILFVLIFALPVSAADPSPLANFKYQTVGIGTTLAEFKRQYPTAVYTAQMSDRAAGVESYTVVEPPHADALLCEVVDGKVYSIQVLYYAARINKLGGLEAVSRKMIERFGATSAIDRQADGYGVLRWTDEAVNRRAALSVQNDAMLLMVVDSSVESMLNDRRAKNANLGF